MNVEQIAARLMQDEVVAYPTEAVFGLGCNPLSESAVNFSLFSALYSSESANWFSISASLEECLFIFSSN